MVSANELTMRLDDQLRDWLDGYADKFHRKPNNKRDRSKAARHVLSEVFALQELPEVAAILDQQDLVINGDITVLIRHAMAEYLANLGRRDTEHTLQ